MMINQGHTFGGSRLRRTSLQAVNKSRGSVFRAADEANLELFGVHLGNTLTKSRLYASIL